MKNITLRSPNGWQRLGILISTLIAVVNLMIAYEGYRSVYINYEVPIKLQKLTGQKFVNEVYWDARSKDGRLSSCVLSTIIVKADGFVSGSEGDAAVSGASVLGSETVGKKQGLWTSAVIQCEKAIGRVVLDLLPEAVAPFVIVFGVGYTFAWIASGFRQGSERRQIDISTKSIRDALVKILIYLGVFIGLVMFILSTYS